MYMAFSCTCLQRNGADFQWYQTFFFLFFFKKGLTKRCNSTTNKKVIFSQTWVVFCAEYATKKRKKRSMLPNKRGNNEKSDGVQMTGAIPLLMLPSLKWKNIGGEGGSFSNTCRWPPAFWMWTLGSIPLRIAWFPWIFRLEQNSSGIPFSYTWTYSDIQ